MMRFLFRRKSEGAPFVHPLKPVPRTAILAGGFEESRLVRVFPEGWSEDVERFRPLAVAATLKTLRDLAEKKVTIPHAVIVLSHGFRQTLRDADRDWLWHEFGVPVYEQVLGPHNRMLAMECEAHDGLHAVVDVPGSELETSVCECGSAVPRLMPVEDVNSVSALA